MRSRVQAAEMRYLRQVAGFRRIDKVRNRTIREKLNTEMLLLKVERSQLRWFGHVLKITRNRLVYQVYSAGPNANRPRGRARARWTVEIRNLCARVGVDYTRGGETASGWYLWRSKNAGLCPDLRRIKGNRYWLIDWLIFYIDNSVPMFLEDWKNAIKICCLAFNIYRFHQSKRLVYLWKLRNKKHKLETVYCPSQAYILKF